jgi:hypothetical protein
VLPFNAPALPAVGGVPLNGLQKIDGSPIQGDLQVPGGNFIPDAQPEEPNINGPNNVMLNYMFTQDWRPEPVLLSHLERKRNAQFYRIWANYFAPAGNPELSMQIPKKWAPFFMSNLLHKDSFNWSKSFLSSDIPSALLELSLRPTLWPSPRNALMASSLNLFSRKNLLAMSLLPQTRPLSPPSLLLWSLT